MKKIELLAPAGSLEGLKAAINAGADAVYIGGSRFGARAYADNLSTEEMKWAIDYAHLHQTALYLTVNTLLKEKELEEQLYSYLLPYYEQGLDAVIVQDFGVLCALKEWFPDLPVHVSTQMTVTGKEGFDFLNQFSNVTRIVTSRELSLEEIREIRENTDLEIESFIHGALCYCYSGQCLMSSLIGGRSGNRGRCAQPCRLPYDVCYHGKKISSGEEAYILSPKDLNTLEILPQLLDAGIDSLKIEGRMKRPEYTAGVVSIYRKYIDAYLETGGRDRKIRREDVLFLEELFRKRGYSKGFYQQHNGRNMMALSAPSLEKEESERTILMDNLAEIYMKTEKKEKINGFLEISTEKPMKLLLQWRDIEAAAAGDCAFVPENRTMTEKDIDKQIRKTGNTPFEFDNLQIFLDGDVFVPNGSLNHLRRTALALLEEKILQQYRRTVSKEWLSAVPEKKKAVCLKEKLEFHVSVETAEQMESVLKEDFVRTIYVDSSLFTMTELSSMYDKIKILNQKRVFYVLPPVFRAETAKRYTEEYHSLGVLPWDGFVVKNLESMQWLIALGNDKPVITDAGLYTFNHRSAAFWKSQSRVVMETLPFELNANEMRDRGCEDSILTVYGYQPMMISAGCVYRSLRKCRKKENGRAKPMEYFRLRDRKKAEFAVKPVCRECYNVIYNSVPLCLLNCKKQCLDLGISVLKISFTLENGDEVKKILKIFRKNYVENIPVKETFEFTRGHFKRGVE